MGAAATIRGILGAAAIAAALGTAGARAVEPRFLFPGAFPARAIGDAPAGDGAAVLTASARDGAPVRALWLEGPAGAPVLVHFHNNRDVADDSLDLARTLRSRGLGVALAEYRGYGRSASAHEPPSQEGLFLDAEAVLDALAARGVSSDRVVLWGTSLGTGVAAEMARRGRGRALVLVTPYTSIPEVVTAHAPWATPFAPLAVRDRFDTAAIAAGVRVPVLVVHGDADEIVPYAMGARLARTFPSAELLTVRGGRHGDLFVREGARIADAIAALAGARR